jgi:thiamine biosynthesis lipoprotein
MGSPCEIRLLAPDAATAGRAVAAATAEIERLESKYSRYRRGNLLHRVNQAAAAGSSISVDEELGSLLDYADTCYRLSDGLFDITAGVLRQAWTFDSGQLPERAQVDALLDRIGWHHVHRDGLRLTFGRKGMELDLGGLVKEYGVDRAANICAEQGIRHGTVDLGGDIKVIGPLPGGEPWLIDIRHPREPGRMIARVALERGALASSGDYERCLVIDGERYGHILSPKTGWPVRGLATVSVLADQCIVAGSSCTIAMLKARQGPGWLGELGLPHLWMDLDGARGGSPESETLGIHWLTP